jgi:hypothetical protein
MITTAASSFASDTLRQFICTFLYSGLMSCYADGILNKLELLMKKLHFATGAIAAIAAIATASLVNTASFAAETVFPKKNRTLVVKQPDECKQWKAPLPNTQTKVEFPEDGKGLKGNAALLVRISADGTYQGLIDYLADDDAYVRAAEKSVKEWTFTPAQCNGAPVASDARVDFEFRREGGITYKSGSSSFNK